MEKVVGEIRKLAHNNKNQRLCQKTREGVDRLPPPRFCGANADILLIIVAFPCISYSGSALNLNLGKTNHR